MARPVEPVVLDRHWDVGSLLGESFKLFFRHAGLFLPITAIIAIPYVVVTDLIWGEQFTSDSPSVVSVVLPTVLGATVVPALITALHVVSLLRLAEGERPSVGEAFALAGDRAGTAVVTTLLFTLVVGLGLVALIVPGVYLGVLLYLGVQASVVDRLGPVDALKRSAELVRGRWWQTFGRFLLAGIVFALITIPLAAPLSLLDFGVAYVVLDVVVQTVVLSLGALFGTLVFMDYHAPGVATPAAYGGFEPPRPPAPDRSDVS